MYTEKEIFVYSCSDLETNLNSSNIDGSRSNLSIAVIAAWVRSGGADAEKQ